MALSLTSPLNSYPEEPKMFITSTTLNLKPYQSSACLKYEWHTNVSTPPNTPNAPVVEPTIEQSINQSSQQGIHDRAKDLFMPAFTFQEEDNLPTKVDKFMACERYHSQYQRAMTKCTTNL